MSNSGPSAIAGTLPYTEDPAVQPQRHVGRPEVTWTNLMISAPVPTVQPHSAAMTGDKMNKIVDRRRLSPPFPSRHMFCFVTLYSEIFTIISTKGDQLNGFTYLVACHGYIFAMILYVCLIFVANKLSLSRRRSDAVSVSKCQSDGRRRSMCAFCGLVLLQIVKRILTPY